MPMQGIYISADAHPGNPPESGGGFSFLATGERYKQAYGITEDEPDGFKGNLIDGLEALAKAGLPILSICGAADNVVPMAENTNVLKERYEALGGSIRVIAKEGVGHHPHSLEDPSEIVDFIVKHTSGAR